MNIIFKKHIFSVAYQNNLLFYDKRGQLLQPYSHADTESEINDKAAYLSDHENKKTIMISPKKMGCTSENIADPQEYFIKIIKIAKHFLSSLEIKALNRIGSRYFFIIDIDKDFNALNEIVKTKLANLFFLQPDNHLIDFGHFACRFKTNIGKVNLNYGPMTIGQLKSFLEFENTFEKPDAFFFMDIDIFQDTESVDELKSFIFDSYKIAFDYAEMFQKKLME